MNKENRYQIYHTADTIKLTKKTGRTIEGTLNQITKYFGGFSFVIENEKYSPIEFREIITLHEGERLRYSLKIKNMHQDSKTEKRKKSISNLGKKIYSYMRDSLNRRGSEGERE